MYLAHLRTCKRKASEFLPFQQKAFNQACCLAKHEFFEVHLSKGPLFFLLSTLMPCYGKNATLLWLGPLALDPEGNIEKVRMVGAIARRYSKLDSEYQSKISLYFPKIINKVTSS